MKISIALWNNIFALYPYNHRDVREVNFAKVDHLGFAGKALRQDGRYEALAFTDCRLETDLDLTEGGFVEVITYNGYNLYKKDGKMVSEKKINLVTALINLASAIIMLYKANK